MSAYRSLAAGLAACLALAGCTAGNGVPEVESVQQQIVVQSFDDCSGLEQYIEDRVELALRTQLVQALEDERLGPTLGFPGPMAAEAAPPSSGDAQPSAFTTTNVQVGGVDEADFLKNDGTRILVLAGNALQVVKSWPADQLELLSSTPIEFHPLELFLDELGRAVVFSNQYFRDEWANQPWQCDPAKPSSCAPESANTLKITVIDLSHETAPVVVREEYLPGTYLSARRVGSSIRVVTSDTFRWPAGVQTYVDWGVGRGDLALRAAAYDQVVAENERLVRERTLEDWLPKGKRRYPDGTEIEVAYSCREFARPTGAAEPGLLTVVTLDLDATAPLGRTSLVARADEVYASATSLYVANNHWWWWPGAGRDDWTYLHKFDLSQPGSASYLASGAVEGTIVDQFSLDEHDGYLRVATNLTRRVQDASFWRGRPSFTSRVQVLSQSGPALQLVGSTEDLAKDERLYSARFLGDKGYLVTFHEVIRMDPLFTIDLSDPANPRKIGELEIPGYSTYLHPADDDHLLAIGVSDSGAVKLSLYDVSVFAEPRKQSEVAIGTSAGSSEAQSEHKAFNYFPQKGLLAVPFYSQWGEHANDLRVFKVDLQEGITPVGVLPMSDVAGPTYWSNGRWSHGVRRSVMADDFVFAISEGGVRSASVHALATPLGTVVFQAQP